MEVWNKKSKRLLSTFTGAISLFLYIQLDFGQAGTVTKNNNHLLGTCSMPDTMLNSIHTSPLQSLKPWGVRIIIPTYNQKTEREIRKFVQDHRDSKS